MRLTDLLKQILINLWMHKARTALSLFGIIWGTVAVVLLLSLSQAFYKSSMQYLAFLNNGTMFSWPNVTSKPYAGLPQGQKIHVRAPDLQRIIKNIPSIASYSPVYYTPHKFRYGDKQINGVALGVAPSYQSIQQILPMPGGRFINATDINQNHRVAFLDHAMTTAFFGEANPLGKTIYINDIPFLVIGYADDKHKGAMTWSSNSIYIPFTTDMRIWGDRNLHLFFVLPKTNVSSASVKNQLMHLLAARYKFDPSDEQAFIFPDMEESRVFIVWFFNLLELFLAGCGALTLSVGGLSIANMMFLIVTERTREIGLRMALGARQQDILSQFMYETILIVMLGAFIGFAIAYSVIALLQQLPLPDWLGTPQFSPLVMLITTSILTVVAFLAGYFPARKAAVMEPIKALAF